MSDQDDYVIFLRNQRLAVWESLKDLVDRMDQRGPVSDRLIAAWDEGNFQLSILDEQIAAATEKRDLIDRTPTGREPGSGPFPSVTMAEFSAGIAAFQKQFAAATATPRPPVILPHPKAAPVQPSPDGRINWPLIADAETEIWGEPFDHDRSYEHARTRRRPPALAPAVGALVLLGAVFALGWLMAAVL